MISGPTQHHHDASIPKPPACPAATLARPPPRRDYSRASPKQSRYRRHPCARYPWLHTVEHLWISSLKTPSTNDMVAFCQKTFVNLIELFVSRCPATLVDSLIAQEASSAAVPFSCLQRLCVRKYAYIHPGQRNRANCEDCLLHWQSIFDYRPLVNSSVP